MVVVTDVKTDATVTISHRDVNVAVNADLAGTLTPLRDINCYLFSPSGSYLGISAKTDEMGQLSLHLPEQPYRVRADYIGNQFWSEDFIWQDSTINIPHGTGLVAVTRLDAPLEGIKVYAFSPGGNYLGLTQTTDSSGLARFIVPAGKYCFRADYQGNQYWGEDLTLIAHQDNPVQISTGGGSFVLTVSTQEKAPISKPAISGPRTRWWHIPPEI